MTGPRSNFLMEGLERLKKYLELFNDTINPFGFDEYCLWQMSYQEGVKRSRYYYHYIRINNKIMEEAIKDRFDPDVIFDF